ncbi:MAG TPA: hypothetical protein VGV17_00070 [Bosea sp. (in: a-proteobacteria)]|uniref:hypothetical protein n=1 Tax=Bosea sp. (in: a-proteobacteria) TaxID=1871050 RepID=UPI002DDD7646|nr:hypothetical protein [Bosea sp. (in: a-proteobacteria)]HEV2552132.1 hypothetical protein [Bosea sp. (in: a-proteobacteria)]
MRSLICLALAALCAGCHHSDFCADLSFSRSAGLGYRNAGLFNPGTLYLFDQSSATLTRLSDDIPLQKRASDAAPATLTSTRIDGIALTGSFPNEAVKTAIAAAVGTKVAFTAENAVRDDYQSVYTGLAQAYRAGMDAGEDMKGRWFVDEVVAQRGKFYVVVTGIVRADKASLSVGGIKDDNVVDVSVSVPGLATPVKVAVTHGRAVNCSGKSAPCFFSVSVIKPYLGPEKRLSFREGRGVDIDRLSEALRKL